MATYVILLSSLLAVGFVCGERQELIMLEIQPIIYEKTVVKRSPQYGQEQQYQTQAAPDSIPPEYLSLLQQLQAQQPVGPQQPDLHQVLISRQPQTFTGQPRPPPRRLTPEQEQQRRLQENIAQKSIREQEERDVRRQQQAQLQRVYQGAQLDPAYLAQLQQAQQQYVQVPETRQLVQIPQQPDQAQQYVQASAQQQPQYVQIQQAQPEPQPERVSYSQVQFGSTKLPRRLTKLLPQTVQPVQLQPTYVQAQPQPQPQKIVYAQPQQEQVYVQPKTQQQLVYRQPSQEVIYGSENIYQQQARRSQAEVKPTSLPQQYLIETTKVEPTTPQQEQVVQIPKQRPQIYYRPQPNYQDIEASILAQQQQAQYAQQQLEASSTKATPSRSSIYVSTLNSQKSPALRLSKPDSQRPLSQNELNSLINAGFKVSPSSSSTPEYPSYQPQYTYYREIRKRQNKPIPRPVQLSPEERKALEKEGIRNLYRVETAESNDSPVTYVLALSSRPK